MKTHLFRLAYDRLLVLYNFSKHLCLHINCVKALHKLSNKNKNNNHNHINNNNNTNNNDPLGGLLFCLAIHPILRPTTSPLTIGFIDDMTLGGTHKEVSEDVQLFKEEGIKIGLCLNEIECEVIARDHLQPTGSLEGFSVVSSEKCKSSWCPVGSW